MPKTIANFINCVRLSMTDLRSREEGQALVEYALIITMISVASIAVLLALSGKITDVFTSIANAI